MLDRVSFFGLRVSASEVLLTRHDEEFSVWMECLVCVRWWQQCFGSGNLYQPHTFHYNQSNCINSDPYTSKLCAFRCKSHIIGSNQQTRTWTANETLCVSDQPFFRFITKYKRTVNPYSMQPSISSILLTLYSTRRVYYLSIFQTNKYVLAYTKYRYSLIKRQNNNT